MGASDLFLFLSCLRREVLIHYIVPVTSTEYIIIAKISVLILVELFRIIRALVQYLLTFRFIPGGHCGKSGPDATLSFH
jgi:hypothetical protein